VADLLTQTKQNIDSAKVYLCTSTGGGTYHVRSENKFSKYEGTVTIANGLLTHVDEDMDIEGGAPKVHTSTKYEYSNVAAPPGV
jgi:hypothetical protein